MDEPNSPSSGGRAVILALFAFATLSIAGAVRSDGFLDADAASHYQFAKYALRDPYYLLNVWARPLATGLFAIPAAIAGRLGVRLTSLLCAATCALVAWRLAILQRYRKPALAAVFTLGQPLLFLHSFSEMTELPFAAAAGLCFLAYHRRTWTAFCVLASLLPLGRPEGFAFALAAAVALAAHRRPLFIPLLALPTVGWTYFGWLSEHRPGHLWRWLATNWPYSAGSDYPRGLLLHFVLVLPMLVSPLTLPAMWVGMGRGLSAGRDGGTRGRLFGQDHLARCQWLIAAIPLGVLAGHSLLHWLGKLSSNGELRYLLIVSPMWGLLSAAGWEWVFDRFHWRRSVPWAALAVVVPAQLNWIIPVVPLPHRDVWDRARNVVAWYRSSPLRRAYPRLLFIHPGVDYYLNADPNDSVRRLHWDVPTVSANPPGTILIWDPDFSARNSDPDTDVTLATILAAGWEPDAKAEMLSKVNNPPPWEVRAPLEGRVGKPKGDSLVDRTTEWHIFRSREKAAEGRDEH